MNPRPFVTLTLSCVAALAALVAPTLYARSGLPDQVPLVPTPTVTVPPPGPVHLTVTADRDRVLAEGDRTVRLRIDLEADPGTGSRLPTDLVVVLDRSGSMSGDKILDARAAAHELVGQLGAEDRFALVSFSSEARVDVPLSVVADRSAWDRAIESLAPAGSTQMAAGLELGLAQLPAVPGRARRVVLVSDGLPDRRDGLVDLARRAATLETPLTTIGIGLDYDEALMQGLADAGTGNFHWVRRGPELARVLADELDTARETVASGVALDVRGAELVDAAGYPFAAGRVALGSLFAGQRRTLWLTVRVPAGVDGDYDLGEVALSFATPAGDRADLVADAPVVGVTHDARAFYSALGDGWADAVVNNDWNRLKIDVSASVQQGDRAAALEAIARYRQFNDTANAFADNPIVEDNLRQLDLLTIDVETQFRGDDDQRNAWAKSTRVDGYTGSRVGQVRR